MRFVFTIDDKNQDEYENFEDLEFDDKNFIDVATVGCR